MRRRIGKFHAQLLSGATVLSLAVIPQAARAETMHYAIPPQPLDAALRAFGTQSGHPIMVDMALVRTKTSKGVMNEAEPEAALRQLLSGTGLSYRRDGKVFAIVAQSVPRPIAPVTTTIAAAETLTGSAVEGLVVTAQKRRENIQDVPIAISAFTQDKLEVSQIAGGPDLMTQVPNFTFTKTNFSGYSIQIRGIGTQAISATTDAAVAIAFNNTSFIRNRFFEQEFFDLERVEVLRGPQGTLYGRNATAGAINIISAKPSFEYETKTSVDLGSFESRRLEAMVNLPLVEDKAALRFAGAWMTREGFVTNQITGKPIDGRDLWSTRLSLRLSPTDNIDANIIWEHFEENDDRLRSGKQLCKTHVPTEIAGITHVNGVPITQNPGLANTGQGSGGWNGAQGIFSQGCAPNSLYDKDSFQTPNGYSLPYYLPLGAVGLPTRLQDPYVSRSQSGDLRVIESTIDPKYSANSDVAELQVNFDISEHLTLTSETAYATDTLFSMQDFNRFNTAQGAWVQPGGGGWVDDREGVLTQGPIGGIFCDPQLGCSDRLVAVDSSTAHSTHFSQEFRLSSQYDGAFNFSVGGNFLRYDTVDKYYVFINSLSIISSIAPFGTTGTLPPYVAGETDNSECLVHGLISPDYSQAQPILNCTYIDPNPIGSLNDLGHNYFLSKNPYKLLSYAVFGEAYYNFTDNLKLTAGLRVTKDQKQAPLMPSWLLASTTAGYPVAEVVEQEWTEPTGRLALDWKPDLAFTDDTLLYASYAHGYKAGGANPPLYGVALFGGLGPNIPDIIIADSAAHPKTFDPEFVEAFEVGTKNTLLDGRMTVNANAFYYDYQGYQISQIIDRSASNLNFDATVWGLELEVDWQPLENLRFGFKGGYENTRVKDGEKAIDIMNRTAGVPGWVVVKPFPSIPSNCILPEWLFLGNTSDAGDPELVNLGGAAGGNPGGCELAYKLGVDPGAVSAGHFGTINYAAYSTDVADFPGWPDGVPLGNVYPGWDPATAPHNGEGFDTDLSGNELPNAPSFTATITADWSLPMGSDWTATLHTDLYYQSEAWTRIFNLDGYDKLKAYYNVNLAAIFVNEDSGWNVMAYVKNALDRDSITGAFLNSDDTGLTTNIFLTEPRHYGVRVSKNWSGIPFWKQEGGKQHEPGTPYFLTLELGGQVQRQDAPNETVYPSVGPFGNGVDNFDDVQGEDLDWGDGREFKLTVQPGDSPWKASLSARYGRTNGHSKLRAEDPSDPVCAFNGSFEQFCAVYGDTYYLTPPNFSDVSARNSEEHQFIDFVVSRDVGLGGLSRSAVGLGVRYAQFQSTTSAHQDGIGDAVLPEGFYNEKYVAHFHRNVSDVSARREFEGEGPILSWDAGATLFDAGAAGRVDVDWSVAGGVMFGRQKTTLTSEEEHRYYELTGFPLITNLVSGYWTEPDAVDEAGFSIHRSQSATSPTVGGSLGLSYNLERVSVGIGYRWERYFDVLDGGGTGGEAQVDRTVDGPYFKVAIGLGG